MTLSELFSKTNIEIMCLLNKGDYHVREIAEVLDISPSKAHQAVKLFAEYNLVHTRKKKNLKIISLNEESLLADQILDIIDTVKYINTGQSDIQKEVSNGEEEA